MTSESCIVHICARAPVVRHVLVLQLYCRTTRKLTPDNLAKEQMLSG